MFAKQEEKRARLSKTDGPKSHVCYGIHTRSAGRPAADLKNTHFQQLTRYASPITPYHYILCVMVSNTGQLMLIVPTSLTSRYVMGEDNE